MTKEQHSPWTDLVHLLKAGVGGHRVVEGKLVVLTLGCLGEQGKVQEQGKMQGQGKV